MTEQVIKSYIERIMRLKEEQDGIGSDIKDIYKEVKDQGFDKTALGQVVAIIRKKLKDPSAYEERSAIAELYLAAYEGVKSDAPRAHAHEAAEIRAA